MSIEPDPNLMEVYNPNCPLKKAIEQAPLELISRQDLENLRIKCPTSERKEVGAIISELLPLEAIQSYKMSGWGIGMAFLGVAGFIISGLACWYVLSGATGAIWVLIITLLSAIVGVSGWQISKKAEEKYLPYLPSEGTAYLYARIVRAQSKAQVQLVEWKHSKARHSGFDGRHYYINCQSLTPIFEKSFDAFSIAEAEQCLEVFGEYASELRATHRASEISTNTYKELQKQARLLNRTV